MVNVEIKQLYHRQKSQIGIFFKYNDELIRLAKSIECKFSASHKCWYIENTTPNKERVIKLFEQKAKIGLKKTDEDRIDHSTQLRHELVEDSHKEMIEFSKLLITLGYSKRTIDVYLSLLSLFLGYCRKPATEIEQSDISKFDYEIMIKRNYSVSVRRQMIGALKKFFQHHSNNKINVEELKRPRLHRTLPTVLSGEEIWQHLDKELII